VNSKHVKPTDFDQSLVSIIIRTKNEEQWIGECLHAVFNQKHLKIEVIIVDNQSDDKTVEKALKYPVKVITIDKFKPGAAINRGVEASSGDIIICLSAHCVPTNDMWVTNLISGLKNPKIAGVYGRQEPLSFSTALNKRDLYLTFGLDARTQVKDTFFHNANSSFLKSTWSKLPFDESVTNIEDRIWGEAVVNNGFQIFYDPSASVFHWHGIHQDSNLERASSIVNIMEELQSYTPKMLPEFVERSVNYAVIPIRGTSLKLNNRYLLESTINIALASKRIDEVFVFTDNEQTAKLAESLGAKSPELRPTSLSSDKTDMVDILKFALESIEQNYEIPDQIVMLEEIYPFRPNNLIDNMILTSLKHGFGSLIAAKKETRSLWEESANGINTINEGFIPSAVRKRTLWRGILGVCSVIRANLVRKKSWQQKPDGFFDLGDSIADYRVTTYEQFEELKKLFPS
jgi:rhamnosyltransferase